MAPRPDLWKTKCTTFAHAPFVVISAIKNRIASGPFLIKASFTRFLISARSGTVLLRSQNFYQLEVVSAENKMIKAVESSKGFFYMPDYRRERSALPVI
jgi:hypothetical protein